jgi:hypothetical protein
MPIPLPSTVDSKPVFEKEDGTRIVDLSAQSMNITVDQPMINFVIVNEDNAMRIDIISQVSMGGVSQTEKMLKFNDISNPFTIDIGDILFIPDVIYANINMQRGDSRNQQKKDIRAQYIDPEKASVVDPTLTEFTGRDKPKPADPEKTTPALPPNFANVGEKEIEIKGGKIFFGPNVGRNGNECDEPLSKSEFLAKLIKNRIKNSSK